MESSQQTPESVSKTPLTDAILKARGVGKYGQLIALCRRLERRNNDHATALRDAVSAFEGKTEIVITNERIEAWKHALES